MHKSKTHLFSENDDETTEDADEVNKQVDGVSNEILVSVATLLNDQLSVVEHKAAHEEQTDVEVHLRQGTPVFIRITVS